mmetsp:Transcript_17078/g.28521  ORF Transcript_17078/g.28521 Transcript_17078/m.28521 type:complete len:735 (+) Transcript_17078:98-2302(+)
MAEEGDYLEEVAAGLRNRTVKDPANYLSRMRTLSNIMWKNESVRSETLELDEGGQPVFYAGRARNIRRLKLPLTKTGVSRLFAAISIDPDLPQKRFRSSSSSTSSQPPEEDNIPEHLRAETEVEAIINPAKTIATIGAQSFVSFKSAFKWFVNTHRPVWNKEGAEWTKEIDDAVQLQIKGYKKDVGQKKRAGIMRFKDGKRKYSLHGYIEICSHFNRIQPNQQENTWKEGLFASLFTKISVNTIGRSDNVDDILLRHLDFTNDALTVLFVTTKSDQAGERTAEIKRMYANPFKPEICLHLDLAIYTFCIYRHNEKQCTYLFEGREQKERYQKALNKAKVNIPTHIDLGCDREDIGSHSNRKFAESMAVSRIDGPNKTQVSLRAGQSIGRTQDCYVSQEDDGDALVGRVVAQLQLTADEFDILPPHFTEEVERELHDVGWDNIYPGYKHHPSSFQRVIRKLFPGLLYHYSTGHLQARCVPDHPIWRTALFTHYDHLLESLKDKVIFEFGVCEQTSMYAEGIPNSVNICRELRTKHAEQLKKYDEMMENFIELREEVRNNNQELNTLVRTELPRQIADNITSTFEINGAIALTAENARHVFTDLISQPEGPIQQLLEGQRALMQATSSDDSNNNHHATATTTTAENSSDHPNYNHLHRWPASQEFHKVPQNFKWPSDTPHAMWQLWFRGNPAQRIGPYKSISPRFDLPNKICKCRQAKTARVLNALVNIAVSSHSS